MYFDFSCMKLRKHGREPLFGHGNTSEWGLPVDNIICLLCVDGIYLVEAKAFLLLSYLPPPSHPLPPDTETTATPPPTSPLSLSFFFLCDRGKLYTIKSRLLFGQCCKKPSSEFTQFIWLAPF